jgi:two-component system sensor histidine kinase CiaH
MMFESARIKLTAWYLLIIMLISASFSVAIYKELTLELNRMERMHRLRIERRLPEDRGLLPPPNGLDESPRALLLDPSLINETKNRLKIILGLVNLAIFAASAMAGYFLAGKTLRPIEKAMAEQKRFIDDASHELRTPLTAMKTSLEVALRERKISLREIKKVIKSNLEEVDNLDALSTGLLNLSRYQQGKNNFVFTKVDLRQVIDRAQKKITPLAKKKKIKLNLKIKNHSLTAEAVSLEEMLVIFLDNAVKYTPRKGRITLIAKKDNKNSLIEIKDNGVGIEKKHLPHLFERFYRIDQARSKNKVEGFGLGLALAKEIIKIHHGSVKVSSLAGKGTTFTIKLPLKHS